MGDRFGINFIIGSRIDLDIEIVIEFEYEQYKFYEYPVHCHLYLTSEITFKSQNQSN